MSHLPPRRRVGGLSLSLLVLLLGISGCSPLSVPLVDDIDRDGLTALGFTQQGDLVESCGAQLGFGCSAPLYELVFRAPASTSVDESCAWIVDSALGLGAPVGYASYGGEAGPWPDDPAVVRSFCVDGLKARVPDPAGSPFYQGTIAVDAGDADGIGKNLIITRDPGGAFVVTIAFSRDPGRIAAFVGEAEPRHLTTEDVEKNAQLLDELAASQQFANTLIGMTEVEAIAALDAAGYTHYDLRTEGFPDADPRRIGLTTSEGIVLDAIAG